MMAANPRGEDLSMKPAGALFRANNPEAHRISGTVGVVRQNHRDRDKAPMELVLEQLDNSIDRLATAMAALEGRLHPVLEVPASSSEVPLEPPNAMPSLVVAVGRAGDRVRLLCLQAESLLERLAL